MTCFTAAMATLSKLFIVLRGINASCKTLWRFHFIYSGIINKPGYM